MAENVAKDLVLTPLDYQRAIDAQDACNMLGVVNSLHEVLQKIRRDPEAVAKGTDAINKHSIVVLYADKIKDLAGRDFYRAYEICKNKGKEGGE